jgi:DNA-binding MarR family transcriptional regulator
MLTPVTTQRDDLGGLLARATRRLIDAERPILERHRLSMWEYIVLSRLAAGAAPMQGVLAREIGHDPTRLIGVLDRLEAEGLVARRPDQRDRRSNVVTITAAGRKRQSAAQAEIHAMEDELLRGIPARERNAQRELLARLGNGD